MVGTQLGPKMDHSIVLFWRHPAIWRLEHCGQRTSTNGRDDYATSKEGHLANGALISIHVDVVG